MKIGYSLILSEVIAAHELEYGDCAKFQVTCPVCRSAVFKSIRAKDADNENHFLSHYRADSEDAKQCELRVASIAESVLRQWTIEGRQQTLQRFLAVLPQEIFNALSMFEFVNLEDMRKTVTYIAARPDMYKFFTCMSPYFDKMIDESATIAKILQNMKAYKTKSIFWARKQSGYIVDIWQHLTLNQAKKNMYFLVCCAMYIYARHTSELQDTAVNTETERDGAQETILAIVNRKSPGAVRKTIWRGREKRFGNEPKNTVLVNNNDHSFSWAQSVVEKTNTDQLRNQLLSEKSVLDKTQSMLEKKIEQVTTEIVGLQMLVLIIGPMLGLLAAVPFPDIAEKLLSGKDKVAGG